jgi:hypothetical protein
VSPTRTGALIATALLSGCGSGGRGGATDAAPADAIDAGPDADPYCHIDCFGQLSCSDGVQTIQQHEPIPCDEPPFPECRVTELRCPGGCRIDGFETFWDASSATYQRWLCLAEPDAVAGQWCSDERDCWPTTALADADGDLSTMFLECADGQCVAAIGPELAGLGQPCATPSPVPTAESFTVVVDDPLFPDPLAPACLIYPSPTCVHAARTQLCWGDWHCPQGAFCETSTTPPVCRAGPRAPLVGDDLPCALPPT